MTKRHTNKYRVCRQLGVGQWFINWNETKQVKIQKSPGEHGKLHKKYSDNRYEPLYSTQLKEKQKLKKYYGEINESQFHMIFQEAMKLKGQPTSNIYTLLERRLDAVVYRMGFSKTIFEARQLINHGHVFCDNMKVTIPSYRVKNGEIISLSESIKKKLNEFLISHAIPSYLEVDIPSYRGVFLRSPMIQEIPYSKEFNLKAIIEFYSK